MSAWAVIACGISTRPRLACGLTCCTAPLRRISEATAGRLPCLYTRTSRRLDLGCSRLCCSLRLAAHCCPCKVVMHSTWRSRISQNRQPCVAGPQCASQAAHVAYKDEFQLRGGSHGCDAPRIEWYCTGLWHSTSDATFSGLLAEN